MLRLLEQSLVYLLVLAANKQARSLPCSDGHMRKLGKLVLQDDCFDLGGDFFRAICALKENNVTVLSVDVLACAYSAGDNSIGPLADKSERW